MYWEWLPQIMYNHHQTGPAGTVIFTPPFRDPFNYNFDPMVVTGHRPGRRRRCITASCRRASPASRCAPARQLLDLVERRTAHDGVLPEHHRPADRDHRQSDADDRFRLSQSDDPAARRSARADRTAGVALPAVDRLLGDGQLRRPRSGVALQGSSSSTTSTRWDRTRSTAARSDHWTISERRHRAAADRDAGRRRPPAAAAGGPGGGRGGRGGRGAAPGGRCAAAPDGHGGSGDAGAALSLTTYTSVMKDPSRRDPRVFIVTADQADFATATKFINTLRYIGVEVASGDRAADRERQDLSGRDVRRQDGAGRPRARARHVRAAGSSQRHGRARHSAPSVRQRRLDARLPDGRQVRSRLRRRDGSVQGGRGTGRTAAREDFRRRRGRLPALAGRVNDTFTIANRVLKAGGEVYRLAASMAANGHTYAAGSLYVVASAAVDAHRAERGAGARRQPRRDHRSSGGRCDETCGEAHRPLGHAHGLDAVRLDALRARTVRISLHRRLRRRVR